MTNHKNHLNHSYQLNSVEATQAFYSDWASTYDTEIMANGYATPQRCADALAINTDNKNVTILDIGCGTGLSGKILADTGFNQIDGCDINPEMLEIAKTRGVYQALWISEAGAAPLSLFHQAIQKLNKNGLFVFSFNDHTLENPIYENAINDEINNKRFELVFKEYGDHLPGRNIKSNVYVMRKC